MGPGGPGRSTFVRYAFFHTLDVVNLIPTHQPSLDHALYVLQTYAPTPLEHKMSDTPTISQKKPYGIDVEAGKSYFWCQCGLSNKQPFCDGSHKSTSFTPVKYQAEESKKVFFCGCKHSKGKPLCDGTHNSL